jgi:hypothetical protein
MLKAGSEDYTQKALVEAARSSQLFRPGGSIITKTIGSVIILLGCRSVKVETRRFCLLRGTCHVTCTTLPTKARRPWRRRPRTELPKGIRGRAGSVAIPDGSRCWGEILQAALDNARSATKLGDWPEITPRFVRWTSESVPGSQTDSEVHPTEVISDQILRLRRAAVVGPGGRRQGKDPRALEPNLEISL